MIKMINSLVFFITIVIVNIDNFNVYLFVNVNHVHALTLFMNKAE